ncbi:PAS domain S-box protein [Ktedonobacter racemifer]|uniref:histidine kinase n=1 Tax=Ktedonobacter racemifer DSM 44963 TaxID=485913 RepID=D6U328_KTERA|nr:PAS domain S-box protein [Ktedonobacter racemifer]EFH82933.1 PAS/PAC sensor signal transduction histidine kinase [Ktedonobacter racemifer DSM 44963]
MAGEEQTRRITAASRDTLLTILETLPDAFFVVDDVDTIVYANQCAQALTRASPEAFLGHSFWRGAPHLVSTALYHAMRTVRQTREPTEVEYISPVTRTRLHVQLAPTAGGLLLQFHEKQEPIRSQKTFFLEEHLTADVLVNLYVGVGVLTPEGILLDINEAPLADTQIRREEVIGQPFTETPWWSFYPASQQQLREAITRASKGETVRFETVIHPREGMDLHLEATITPHRDVGHRVEYLVYVGTDITARKRAEAELHALIDAIPQLVWAGRPDGYVDFYNQRWRDYTGLSTEEAQGEGWMQCTHPEDRQRVLETWQRAVQTGSPYEAEQRLRHCTTGQYRWFLMQATPYRDARGTILKYIGTCTDIDEQKQVEERIKASEENWRVLAETVPQLVWTTRPDGLSDYFNQRFRDYTHATWEQLYGYGWSQFLHPEDYERTLAERAHSFRRGTPYEVAYRFREGQTGCYRWFLARAMPVRDETGQILKWFGTCTDIDEQKRTEQRLKESEERFQVLAETVPQLVWTTRPDGQFEYTNQHWCDYTGLTLEQTQSDQWAQLPFIHPDDQEDIRARWQHALETGDMYEHEGLLKHAHTGEYRWFLTRAMPVRDEAGQILKWCGTCTDIHDKKRAEAELRVLIDAIPQHVWILGPDGLSEYGNQRWCEYTGMTYQQYQGDGWHQAIHPDDRQHTLTLWRQTCAMGEPFEIEYRLKHGQTGTYRWFLGRALPVRDETGQILKWFGTCTDIEEQKRIEAALRESQERTSVLMNSSIIGINIAEGEQIVDANDTFLYMTGYTREDLRTGKINWMQMTPPEYLDRTVEAHQELAAKRLMTPYEKEYVCKDGSRLPVLVGSIGLEHNPLQNIAFVLDNSARQELEQRKDAFISMASHELRNPLTALKMQTSLLHRQLVKQGLQAPALSSMQTQINKITRLVEDLLDVSKIQAGRLEYQQEIVDLDALLREIADTMLHTHPSHTILLHGTVGTSLMGDRDRLGQVFTNLLSNAIKYSPGAETVEMELSASEEAVTILVRDHGLGIPREQRDKIFDRFYRVTDPKQKAIPGLGMGLYIVAEIVKHHGGTIMVESEMGKGSTFQVTLPR